MLKLNNISFAYHQDKQIINNLTTTIAPNQITAIAGRNGSGKSTITRIIMGLLQAQEGNIFLDNLQLSTQKTQDIAQFISYVFQDPEQQLFCSTVFEEVAFALRKQKIDEAEVQLKVMQVLTKMQLSDYAFELPQLLSIDQKQRLTIACALVTSPKYLILDEPTSGQDCRQRTKLLRLIQKLKADGIGVIIVTHDMDIIAEHADKVLVLHKGTLAFDGTALELFSNTQLTSELGLELPEAVRISHELGLKLSLTPLELYAQLNATI